MTITDVEQLLPTTADKFERGARLAIPGQPIVYHTGDLQFDRAFGKDKRAIDQIARRAWELHERGQCRLFQKKLSVAVLGDDGKIITPAVYEYRAVRR